VDPFEKHRFLSPDCSFVKERISNETRHLNESDESISDLNSDSDSYDESEWNNTSQVDTKPIGNFLCFGCLKEMPNS